MVSPHHQHVSIHSQGMLVINVCLVLLLSFILKTFHGSITLDVFTGVIEAFQSLLKGVFTLVKDLLVIREFGDQRVFEFAGAFIEFHHICSFFY